ncbi:MAG: AraC family transcriptional regulator [Spirochaetales bacterium]
MLDHAPDLLEKVDHGRPDYPVQSYLGLFSDENVLHLHWHDELELTWVDSGEVVYQVDLEEFRLAAGDLLLITPGALHEASAPTGKKAVTRTLVFHPSFVVSAQPDRVQVAGLSPLFDGRSTFPRVIAARDPRHAELAKLFDTAIRAHLDPSPGGALLVKGGLLMLLAAFLAVRGAGELPRTSRWIDAGRLKAVYAHVSQHYAQAIRLEEVAKLANLGVSSFCRLFKARTGESFVSWLVGFRLQRARQLLRQPGLTLVEIAAQTGFGSAAYFSRCFRAKYGAAPSAQRDRSLSDLAIRTYTEQNPPA